MLPSKPSILLAEDDPIAREVVSVHLHALGCEVKSTAAVAEAIALGNDRRFDALLLDCQLLGGDAQTIVSALRDNPTCPNAQTQAIAMSAELDDGRLETLLQGGFADAMEKPIQRERLRRALLVCDVVGLLDSNATPLQPGVESMQVLDDAAGLQACGNAEVLIGLRILLAAELPAYRMQIDEASFRGDLKALQSCVHRMKSALGFCGAHEMRFLLDRAGSELPGAALLAEWRTAIERLSAALGALQQTR